MANVQPVWGIDIGRCALKAIKIKPAADGKIEIVGQDYVEHEKILSQPDADRQELIATALEQFLSRNDISKDNVVVSVPGQHTLARFCKLPPVATKKIPDIVRYEADQQIPFDMDEVIWDYQIFQEEGAPDIEVGIFAMKRELIREHLLHFEQASIEPIAVQSGPLAVYNACQYEGLLAPETTIILDIGAESTDLIIATPHRLWTRTVNIGGNNFTEALVKAFKLSFAKAESLKRTAQTSKHARPVFQAMLPVFADIVQELQRSLGFYSSTHRDAQVQKVIGVGNAFLLPGLQKYLHQNLNLPVELPEAFKMNSGGALAGAETHRPLFLGYFGAYGLALQGLDIGKVSSNLLPTELAKQVVWRKKRPAFAAAAACLLLGGGLVWFRKTIDSRALASGADASNIKMTVAAAANVIDNGPGGNLPNRARATSVLAAGRTMEQALKSLSGKGDKERKQAEALLTAMENRTVVPRILKVLHESLPSPGEAIAKARDQESLAAAVAAVPRGQRSQAFITGLNMDFVPDLNNPVWPTSLVDAEPPLNDFQREISGLLIKMTVVTPNQDGAKFVDGSFIKTLREKGRQPGMGFYLDRVWIIKGEKVEVKGTPGGAAAAAKGGSGGRGGGGRGGAGAGGAKPAVQASNPLSLDPATFESIENDWHLDIWIDVVFGDIESAKQAVADPPKPKPTSKPDKKEKGD